MDSSYDLNSTDFWTGFGEWFDQTYNNGGWEVHQYEFEFEKSLKSIVRQYDVDDWLLDSNSTMDVIWPNDADRINLKDKGYCPQTISFRCKDGCTAGDTGFEFIMPNISGAFGDSGQLLPGMLQFP